MEDKLKRIRKTPGDTQWFTEARFGLFIHWGLYAVPSKGEWAKFYYSISEERYRKYFDHFDPDLYNPKEWARMAKEAGMKYVVITTKHHEGFCLFDSKYTEYKAANTPAGRDLIAPLVEAFRAEGLRIGFYYSLIDWDHPDFPVDIVHPRNHDADVNEKNKNRDMRRYAQYMRDQLKELLTGYGKIDILWLDASYSTDDSLKNLENIFGHLANRRLGGKGKNEWEAEALIKMIREIQPGIIINNRSEVEQDLWTPEQVQPDSWVRHKETGELVTWEACQTFSGSWGYNRDEMTWKGPDMLIRMLVNSVSCGGNLLLNVGPTPRGEFDYRAAASLKAMGEWMHYHSRSIYNCTASDFKAPANCCLTQNGSRLYLHVFAWPLNEIALEGLAGRVEFVRLLQDGTELEWHEISAEPGKNDIILGSENMVNTGVRKNEAVIHLPAVQPKTPVPVIEIFLKS